MLRNIRVNTAPARQAATRGYLNATELADYLARKGVPFRQAHELVGQMVMHAIAKQCELNDLPLDDFKSFSPLIEPDVFAALALEATLGTKSQIGGTSPERVSEALEEAKERMAADARE